MLQDQLQKQLVRLLQILEKDWTRYGKVGKRIIPEDFIHEAEKGKKEVKKKR